MTCLRTIILFLTLSVMTIGPASANPDQPVSDIIFSHELHTIENEIECAVCHASIGASKSSSDRNLPDMDICADCHEVEDETSCGQCHRNTEDPSGVPDMKPSLKFNHARHLESGRNCLTCHSGIVQAEASSFGRFLPDKPTCMPCHDDIEAPADCDLCHYDGVTLADIHPLEWRHQHAEAAVDEEWCSSCHTDDSFCLDCHRGDNLTGSIHDLNYEFTHGLDGRLKQSDCVRCHERRTFCNDCHQAEGRMPLAHSSLGWRTEHGHAARADIENCSSCHETDDPTCARSGCHLDLDGLRGTDHRFHPPGLNRFDTEGNWHEDDGSICFVCHTNTDREGIGFCGYCHSGKEFE